MLDIDDQPEQHAGAVRALQWRPVNNSAVRDAVTEEFEGGVGHGVSFLSIAMLPPQERGDAPGAGLSDQLLNNTAQPSFSAIFSGASSSPYIRDA